MTTIPLTAPPAKRKAARRYVPEVPSEQSYKFWRRLAEDQAYLREVQRRARDAAAASEGGSGAE